MSTEHRSPLHHFCQCGTCNLTGMSPSLISALSPLRLLSEANMRIMKEAGTVMVSRVSSNMMALRAISCRGGADEVGGGVATQRRGR